MRPRPVLFVLFILCIILVCCATYSMIIQKYFRRESDSKTRVSYTSINRFISNVSEGNNYMNYGLWDDDTQTLMEANQNLVDYVFMHSGLKHAKNKKVLDVGCGYGEQDMEWFKQMDSSCSIKAIDISEEQIENAIARAGAGASASLGASLGAGSSNSNLVFEVCDVKDIYLKYSNERFDVIFSLESAFHYPEREMFFKNANELLQRDGRFIITDIVLQNDYAENSWVHKLFIYFFSDVLHIPRQNLISGKEWDKQLASAFVVEQSMDLTEKTFVPMYRHFIATYVENKHLPGVVGTMLSSFFCNNQPFSYKIAVCRKK